jgi:drug/metabolite transporter (DMT)-like permease
MAGPSNGPTKPRPNTKGFGCLLHMTMFYIMLCFAGYTCIGRHLESDSPIFEPLVFLLLRHWSSALILIVVVLLKEGLKLPRSEDVGRLLLCGCLGISATQLLFIFGLRATTATNAACIEPLIPCITFVLAALTGFEKSTCNKTFCLRIFGVVVGCAGAMVTTLGHTRSHLRLQGIGTVPRLGPHLPKFSGDLAILLQCFTLAMYLLLTKELSKKYSPLWLTAYCMFAGACFTSLVTLLSIIASGGEWPGWNEWHFDETFILEEVYASLIASVQNYALRMWAIQYLHATTVSMYFCIDPPATALFAAIFLKESIHARQVIGGVLILFGMYVTIKFGENSSGGGGGGGGGGDGDENGSGKKISLDFEDDGDDDAILISDDETKSFLQRGRGRIQ